MNDQSTVEIEEGVTVSSPDAPEQDVTSGDEDLSMMDSVLAETEIDVEGKPSDPGTEDVDGVKVAETPASTPDANGNDTTTAQNAAGGTDDKDFLKSDPTDEELKNYGDKANARIRDLVSQRNEAAGMANRAAPIVDFLAKNDIPQSDIDVILDMSARLRHGDFAGFLTAVTPYVDLAKQYTGQALPADLQQQVQQGYVSPEIAKELAQSRAQVQIQGSQAQQRKTSDAQQMAHQRGDNIRTAVVSWEQQIRSSDPDYNLKADMVRRTSQALMQEHGAPQNPEQAVQLAKAAYDEVNGQMGKLRPAPKPTLRNPNSTGQNGGTAPVSEPTSMMEAGMQGLHAAHNRG